MCVLFALKVLKLYIHPCLYWVSCVFTPTPYYNLLFYLAIEAVGATIDQMENDGSFEQACTAPR